ncbi:nucleotidyltransferase domain-containing protein [Paenibacillus pasadenensis]|uniref:nucleotidyltransferase domain-containing protein n=1 Tax=Paenibacillus pasadenensis TaxID=217090 RepID=UPI0004166BE8|nr:nucleotidyltransferase domain-containing protein [Paenibacillus pasadenensis]
MEAESILELAVKELSNVQGIAAIALGGSRARGTAHAGSDFDLGLYYRPDAPPDLTQLREAARRLDDESRAEAVTPLGDWGPWINGGGWLRVGGMPVDLLYRDLDQVERVIGDCRQGSIRIDYQPGHPHGFVSSIYLAEAALCQPLWDPHGVLERLKRSVRPYPPALQRATIGRFLWEASFALDNGRKGIPKGDASYVAGCFFRSVSCLNQTLFALNEAYWMNEKGAAAIAGSLPLAPADYSGRIGRLFAALGDDAEKLAQAASRLQELIRETEALMPANRGL